MIQVGKDDLKKLKIFIKKADIEAIVNETGFSISYVRKVIGGIKYNTAVLVSASEIALLRKNEMDNTVKKFEYNVEYIAQKYIAVHEQEQFRFFKLCLYYA